MQSLRVALGHVLSTTLSHCSGFLVHAEYVGNASWLWCLAQHGGGLDIVVV